MADEPVAAQPLWKIVSALGLAQIISWGTLYYSLTVLSAPIEAELGFTKLVTFGAFTLGLLASGIVAPIVGRRIDSEGGQRTMSMGSLLAALALTIIASAGEAVVFSLGWIVAGLAMGATLYDPVFASIFAAAVDHAWYIEAILAIGFAFICGNYGAWLERKEILIMGWYLLLAGLASLFFIESAPFLWSAILWAGTFFSYGVWGLAFMKPEKRG